MSKKEPKSDDGLSKLSPIFLAILLKVFKNSIKHYLLVIRWYNRADQILTCDCQMLI